MLTARSARRATRLERAAADAKVYQETIHKLKQHVEGLIHVNTEMVKKLAALGLAVKFDQKGDVRFETIQRG